jgi:hypothetical protein
MFQTQVVENFKTHILCSVTFFQKSCHLKEYADTSCRARQVTDDNIHVIWHSHFACWISKPAGTHSEYVIFIAFQCWRWFWKNISMLYLHVHCLFVVYSNNIWTATSCFDEQQKVQATTLKRIEISNFVPVVGSFHIQTMIQLGNLAVYLHIQLLKVFLIFLSNCIEIWYVMCVWMQQLQHFVVYFCMFIGSIYGHCWPFWPLPT